MRNWSHNEGRLLVWALVVVCVLCDENILRIEEKLTADRDFYEQWMHLIALQAQELEEQTRDMPIETEKIVQRLRDCRRTSAHYADHVDYIRPEDVAIYAEIGHLSRFCKHNLTALEAGILDSCLHRGPDMSELSLDKMLRVFSPNISIVTTNTRDLFLTEQARELADAIEEIEDYGKKWKLIVVLATLQDGEASETGQTAVEVLAMLEELERRLPTRTLIAVVETSGKGIWQDASHSHQACREMLSRWRVHTKFNSASVWDQVIKIASKNFRTKNFTVEFLPLLKSGSLSNLPEAMDLSVLGYDCAHFSARGLSLLHSAVWNSLFTRNPERSRQFRAEPVQVLCPDPRCPFLRTQSNSAMCIWNEIENWQSPVPGLLIGVGVLLIALLLASLLLCCVCLSRRKSSYKKKNPHSFGSNFSSIRFIDDEV